MEAILIEQENEIQVKEQEQKPKQQEEQKKEQEFKLPTIDELQIEITDKVFHDSPKEVQRQFLAEWYLPTMFDWFVGKSKGTQRYYFREVFKFFMYVKGLNMNEVTFSHLGAYKMHIEADSKKAPSTQARIITTIKAFFSFAYHTQRIEKNIAFQLKPEKVEDTLIERILSKEEIMKLIINETNPRNNLILRLLYSAGLRNAELADLEWRNVSFNGEKAVLSIFGKGNKTRSVTLSDRMTALLKEWEPERAKPDDPVFRSNKGGKLSTVQVFRIIKKAAKNAGITGAISPHWLRHCHASHSLDNGCDINVISKTLGHSSVATTSRYLHVREGESSSNYLDI